MKIKALSIQAYFWIKEHLKIIIVVVITVVALVLTIMAIVYRNVLGFTGKTLWDWIEVVGIPVVVVIIGGIISIIVQRASKQNEEQKEVNIDRAREETLRSYLEVMSNLIIEKKIKTSEEDSPERAVAHAQTFMALRTLDGPRKLLLLQFLKESGLIDKDKSVVPLYGADLSKANLSSVDLSGTCLRGIWLKDADLRNANLNDANFSDAVLINADLRYANLRNTNFHNADLSDAKITEKQSEKFDDSDALLHDMIVEELEMEEN